MANFLQSAPPPSDDVDRMGYSSMKGRQFFEVATKPELTETLLSVRRFLDINIGFLKHKGIEGLILDVDGTLIPHLEEEFPDEIVGKVAEMIRQGIKVCIFSNKAADRYGPLEALGVQVVKNVPPKPDPAGYRVAMRMMDISDPTKVAMVGENFITDAGSIRAGIPFIHVDPIPGPEKFAHRATRAWGIWWANFYDKVLNRTGARSKEWVAYIEASGMLES